MPNLVLVDSQTFISESDLSFQQYNSCLLIVDNRMPFFLVKKWLHRNSSQFIMVNSVVLRVSENECINRGYEYSTSIDVTLHYTTVIDILTRILMTTPQPESRVKSDELDVFALTEFEADMLNAMMTKEGQAEFCRANSLTTKSCIATGIK